MRFSIDKSSAQMDGAVKYLLGVIGTEPWQKRIRDLERICREFQLLEETVFELYPIELAMGEILGGMLPSDDAYEFSVSRHRYDLLAFATSVFEFHVGASKPAQFRLEGMIRDGLKSDKGLGPLRHELSTAVHMISAGWDVEFVDLEQGGGVDYIGRRNGVELEIECKSISGDLGRQVSRRHAVQAFSEMRPILDEACRGRNGGAMYRVVFPDKLTGNLGQREELVSAVRSAIASSDGSFSNDAFAVSRVTFESEPLIFNPEGGGFNRAVARQYLADRFGIENREMCFVGSPSGGVIGVSLESRRPDKVLQGIGRQLRDSAKSQFTRSRAGILSVQLYAISHDDLLRLGRDSGGSERPSTGFDYLAHEIFRGESTAHMLALAFRSHEPIVSSGEIRGHVLQQTHQASGHCYVSTNMSHPFASVRSANPFLSDMERSPALRRNRRKRRSMW